MKEKGLLLFFLGRFFLRVALFADLFVLGGFDAALVAAFFAGFLGIGAAARLEVSSADGQSECASDKSDEFHAVTSFFLWCVNSPF